MKEQIAYVVFMSVVVFSLVWSQCDSGDAEEESDLKKNRIQLKNV